MTAVSQKCGGMDPVDHNLSDDDTNLSLIYTFLPPLVRSSVPKVRSLRRSIGSYRTFVAHSRNTSLDSSSGSRTPPPAYHEAVTPLTSALSDDEDSTLEKPSSRAGKTASFAEDDHSGIQWKYASQGKTRPYPRKHNIPNKIIRSSSSHACGS